MTALVGYTGFVGSNIYIQGKKSIDAVYNSKNIEDAYHTNPDLLIYSGVRAEKYLANIDPEADMQLVYQAEDNIKKINPKHLVLISTIDVFKNPNSKDENSEVDTIDLHAYGLNRYRLEQWVNENYPNSLTIRLPGLYGINIKKNFIYDYINLIPLMLKKEKFEELSTRDEKIKNFYELQANGFYKCKNIKCNEKIILRDMFKKLGFTALNFTDSRNVYQFYPLSRLWNDIQSALKAGLSIWHPATEPVSASEVYKFLTGDEFTNEFLDTPVYYDYKTKYAELFCGHDGYLMDKNQILKDIKKFVGEFQ